MGKAQSKRGRERQGNNQQCTRKMHKNSHQQTLMLQQCTPQTSNGGRGQRAARERSEGEKSTELPDSTGRGEGGGGTQRVRVAAVMNMWEMLMSADSPTLHRPHTQSKQARGVGM